MIIPSETTKLYVLLSHPILHTTCSDLLIICANLLFFSIFLKGIIVEGKVKGIIEVKPAPYNVVLDDDTFKGQISIGLKYSANAANVSNTCMHSLVLYIYIYMYVCMYVCIYLSSFACTT